MENQKKKFFNSISDFVSNSMPFNKHIKEELKDKDEKIAIQNKLLEDLGIQITEPSLMASDAKRLSDIMNDMTNRIALKNLKAVYLRNQFIFRGINIRASELISRGFNIVGEDDEGVKKCFELIKKSGGASFIRQSSINADVFGNCYWEKIYNTEGTEIGLLKQIHPMTFGFKTKENTSNIIMGSDKTPLAYMQKIDDPNTGYERFVDVPKKKVSHIKYNTFGDEFSGVSILQPVYDTILRLMNMEQSAAIAALKTANPTTVLQTDAKSPVVLAKWAKVVGNVGSQQQVMLGENQKLILLSPGNQNFNDYADYFLTAVVSATAVPRSILLGGDSKSGGNRAETITLSKHFYTAIRDNQLEFERNINDIFKEYGEIAGFKPPRFVFVDVAEDTEAMGQRAMELYNSGLITLAEARTMIGLGGEPGTKVVNVEKEIKDADMKSWHGYKPGSAEGSQKNEKKDMKTSKDSSLKTDNKI